MGWRGGTVSWCGVMAVVALGRRSTILGADGARWGCAVLRSMRGLSRNTTVVYRHVEEEGAGFAQKMMERRQEGHKQVGALMTLRERQIKRASPPRL